MSTARIEKGLCAHHFISFTILLDTKELISIEIDTVERYTPILHDL